MLWKNLNFSGWTAFLGKKCQLVYHSGLYLQVKYAQVVTKHGLWPYITECKAPELRLNIQENLLLPLNCVLN